MSSSTTPTTSLEASSPLACPICLDLMNSPFSTRCGHSFCHDCILFQIHLRPTCPVCNTPFSREDIFPNFALEGALRAHSLASRLQSSSINVNVDELHNLPELRRRIEDLLERKRNLEEEQRSAEIRLLLEFLQITQAQKRKLYEELTSELAVLERDIAKVNQLLLGPGGEEEGNNNTNCNDPSQSETQPEVPVIPEDVIQESAPKRVRIDGELPPSSMVLTEQPSPLSTLPSTATAAASCNYVSLNEPSNSLIKDHFDDLQNCYFDNKGEDSLEVFCGKFNRMTKLTKVKQVSSLRLGDVTGASNIVSSIEFDRDSRLVATSGVSKKIKFYEFRDATDSSLEIHCPIREINCKSKVSCISWNPYISQHIASADYEGLVTVYDANIGAVFCYLEEHEKRCWTVDYSSTDPTKLASGSDDCYVKLWSTKSAKSICTIDGHANICSVRFHPEMGHLLAFGSADHNVHLYDLRKTEKALNILRGHKKAVSYVRFADKHSILSASTDCTLKLWNLEGILQQSTSNESVSYPTDQTSPLIRSYSGHVNEKNFVGLGIQGDLFACGSENNSVYIYHRDLTRPLTSFHFSNTCPLTQSPLESEIQQFVSSLCWKADSNMLVAANSQGHIKVLEVA